MIPDIIDAEMAQRLQNKGIQEDDLWIWTVYFNAPYFPDQFIALPHSTRRQIALRSCLVAQTLEGIRKQLPWGLTRLGRAPEDHPDIVESWV